MNPMVVAFWVLVGVILVIWVIGSLVAIIFTAADAFDGGSWVYPPIALVSLVVAITVGILIGNATITDDSAQHCGPGTHYVELHDGKYSTWECAA